MGRAVQNALAALDCTVYIVFQYCLGICSCNVVLKESCLEINEFYSQQKFMTVLSPLYVSFVHNPDTRCSQLAALPLCVCWYPCHVDAKYLHISALQVQVQTYSIFLL